MFKLGLEKAEEPEIKLPKSAGSSKKQEFQKNIFFCFTDYAKTFDCVDHNKLWEILQEMGIPDHLICLLRNLYAGQEATVRFGHGTTDWFQIGKGVRQGCIVTLLIQLKCRVHHEKRWAGWSTSWNQDFSRRNINNLRYADDTTLITESEEIKSLLMKVKEENENLGLKLNIKKTKIMASGPFTSWQIDGAKSGNSDRFYFGGLQNHCRWWLQPWN